MPTAVLYTVMVLVWGLTWTAIDMQVGAAPVTVSVFYRFALAAGLVLAFLAWRGALPRPGVREQGLLIAQGLCLYCVNFLLLYRATGLLPSGLVAVVFSLASLLNAFNGWIFLRQIPGPRVYLAAALGACGVALLFHSELRWSGDAWSGLGLAFLGTYSFSLGNIAGSRLQHRGLPVLTANAWAMAYGAAALASWLALTGAALVLPADGAYWGAMAYLVLIGTVVGFWTYLTLIRRIGVVKAGYATVLFPVVALTASTWLEDYRWTPMAVTGLGLVMLGNFVTFRRGGAAAAALAWMRARTPRGRRSGTAP
ncbi:MAG TPA: DMT family transporter [Arenicellales bacterium]|nr:DMT family transporter [Arenicellales bacterium]